MTKAEKFSETAVGTIVPIETITEEQSPADTIAQLTAALQQAHQAIAQFQDELGEHEITIRTLEKISNQRAQEVFNLEREVLKLTRQLKKEETT